MPVATDGRSLIPRRSGGSSADARGLWTAFLLATLVMVLLPAMTGHIFTDVTDPDTLMRIARLRQALSTGEWSQLIPGGNLGAGMELHWSRLIDGVMLPFVTVLTPPLGMDRALLETARFAGPVGTGLVAALCCWCLAPLVAPASTGRIVPAFVVLSPIFLNYGRLGNGDHHVAMAAVFVFSVGSALRLACGAAHPLFREGSAVPARGLGVAHGLGLGVAAWLAPEALLFALLPTAYLWCHWATEGDAALARRLARGLRAAAAAFLAVVVVAIAIDPPVGGGWAVDIDRVSLPFAVLALVHAVGAVLAVGIDDRRGRLALLVVAGGAGAALALLFRQQWSAQLWSTDGFALGEIDWSGIKELRPLDTAARLIGYAGLGLCGSACLLLLARGLAPLRWAVAALLLAVPLVLAVLHMRFALYPTALGVIGVTWILAASPSTLPSRPVVGAFAGFVLALAPLFVLAFGEPAETDPLDGVHGCSTKTVAPFLPADPRPLVLASSNLGANLAWHAPQAAFVGANYHRNVRGQLVDLEIQAAAIEAVPDLLRRHGVTHLLACIAPGDPAGAPPWSETGGTVFERLYSGAVPTWLRPLTPPDRKGGAALFAVAAETTAGSAAGGR